MGSDENHALLDALLASAVPDSQLNGCVVHVCVHAISGAQIYSETCHVLEDFGKVVKLSAAALKVLSLIHI